MPFIEAPTTFYLGRRYDSAAHRLADEVVYYDSRDLTTHAVVVGMTGSGKTGLCIDLLEEAVLDNIPSIVIDPKGDITNLLLAFPSLRAEDFAPWINLDDARRAGLDAEEYTRDIAQQWRDGLSSWGIVPQRIAAFKNAAQFSIYTPGSDAGLPVSILDSLQAPREGWVGFEEAHRERISGIVTALLALIGKQVDPVKDREHVLIANIFETAWSTGRDLSLEDIILQVQKPPFAKLGVFDVNTFFPEKDRFRLAMELNNIIAAPSFQSWINGESMDIQQLLYTAEGRPRVSIFYVAHLSEAERTFMITLLLENILAWMRTLSGTTSLRALLYFDEVFGHFPPAPRNPPTKEPLLRLLKQARAFGLGVILATQNPGDLDYKGLSNAGTWLIGKLQTENDKSRVLGGLQAAATAESHLDMDQIGKLLSALDPRVFVLHNIHNEGGPILVHSRWSMSYLRGPLTRQQIRILMDPQRRARGLQGNGPQSVLGQTPAPIPRLATAAAPTPVPTTNPPPTSPPPTYGTKPLSAVQPLPPPTSPEQHRVPSAAPASILGGGELPPPAAPPDLPELSATPPIPPELPPESSTVTLPPIEESFPVNPAPDDNATINLPSQPIRAQVGRQNVTGATELGPELPEGYSSKPTALPASVAQFYLPTTITTQQAIRQWEKKFGYEASSFGGAQLLYKPVLLAQLLVRYLDRKINVEEDQRWAFHVPNVEKAGLIHWAEYQATELDPNQISGEPFGEAFYGPLSPGLTDSKRMTALKVEVIDYVYRSASLSIFFNSKLDIYGGPRDNRRDFLVKAQQAAREARDAEVDEVTQRYDRELERLEDRLKKEMRDLTYEQQTFNELKREDLYTTGEAVLNLLRGRTTYTLSRMSRSRRFKKQAQERTHASEQAVIDTEDEIERKQQELQTSLKDVNDKWAKIAANVEETKLTPYKKDITLEIYGIGWIPMWYTVLNGQATMLPASPGRTLSPSADS